MRRRRVILALLGSVLLGALLAAPTVQAGGSERPSRVLILMLDQARPDTIERYGMKNVQALQRRGVSFPNALVGHMAAETTVSHGVITSGQFPKHMGWSNEVHRDVDGVLGAPGDYYVTSSLTCDQFKALIEHGGYKKLPDYLDDRFGADSKFVSIAQKRTAVCPAGPTSSAADGTPTDPEDIMFQIRGSSSPTACDRSYHTSDWRQPEFVSGNPPPAYLGLALPCSRWSTWQAAGAYGTNSILPGAIYPLEGDRFVPGRDDLHVGGDNWSADAAIRVIEADRDWRGMLVSLGAIDKMGHMWGPEDDVTGPPGSDQQISHLPFAAKNADAQVGRIVDALKKASHSRRHADRAHGRPRRADRRPLPRPPRRADHVQRDPLRRRERLERTALGLQLVLRAGRRRGLPRPEPGDRGVQGRPHSRRRGHQSPLLLPGRAHRRLA